MSIANPTPLSSPHSENAEASSLNQRLVLLDAVARMQHALERVQDTIAPVWPLKDYVAVNPYLGFANQDFLGARRSLQRVSDFETLMSPDYYRRQFHQGSILKSDIDAAVDEMVSDGVPGAETIDVNQVLALLHQESVAETIAETNASDTSKQGRLIRTISEVLDGIHSSHWTAVIRDEVSKHCAAHYDQGQATWPSPWQHLPLYEAWRKAMQHDRSFELLGVPGFRSLVAELPNQPEAALVQLMERLEVPDELWQEFLQCHAMATIGWSAWTRYKQRQAASTGEEDSDFAGLLVMRLAHDVAISECFALKVDWDSILNFRQVSDEASWQSSKEELLRYALLKASEIAYRRMLLADLSGKSAGTGPASDASDHHLSHETISSETSLRPLAQMVFCIDVRSERIRRHLEAACNQIKTYGFAGFFGLPIGYVPLGETEPIAQLPVLLSPQFHVHEQIAGSVASQSDQVVATRSIIRAIRQSWKEFQASAASCFGFVETTGLLYGWKLVARSFGIRTGGSNGGSGVRFDGVPKQHRDQLGPCLHGLEASGVSQRKQVDMAESILRGIGIVDGFAPLVVLCGHGSQTENNPLQAGLDCGACGGHSGEANSRFAAKLLNQKHVRQALSQRGISIGDDVQFVGALHNTTTDELQFFDVDGLPETHRADLVRLKTHAAAASQSNRSERLSVLPGRDPAELIRRSLDWSEVRPEWGLAGNAAFIAAPRDLTGNVSLAGRAFLHSYDYRLDPNFKVLEQIMTAPMVVANWINMQYYASTVDPSHFGSGNKAIHNVVGRFGILSGNGGDLMTGLPWQSIHDGASFQHHPLRLLVVLAAPRKAIARVIQSHESIRNLLTNGWLQLLAIDDESYYRFTERQTWDRLPVDAGESIAAEFASFA